MIDRETKRELQVQGLDNVLGTNINWYDAIVEDINDPVNLHRIKVNYNGNVSDWCLFNGTFSGNGYGMFVLPRVGDNVIITTVTGASQVNANNPFIWDFGKVAVGEKPNEATTNAYTIIMPNGNRIKIDFDSATSPITIVHSSGNTVEVGSNITITHNNGNVIEVGNDIDLQHSATGRVRINNTLLIGNSVNTLGQILKDAFTALNGDPALTSAKPVLGALLLQLPLIFD